MSRGIQKYHTSSDLENLVTELIKLNPNQDSLKNYCKKLSIPFSRDPTQLMTTVLASFDDISQKTNTPAKAIDL